MRAVLPTLAKNLLATTLFVTGLAFAGTPAIADEAPDVSNWDSVTEQARGQTVYFNAWGGAPNINAYIEWAGAQLKEQYGVTLIHVKLDDTANAVAKVVTEKAAGRNDGGSVDLIWINGENFAAMKREDMLLSPGWAEKIPNWSLADFEAKPTLRTDFTIPVEGLASPWGMGKLVFFHDSATLDAKDTPKSSAELLAWATKNPGRFAYPQPPDFVGSSFLKQVLHENIADPSLLLAPVVEANFDALTKETFEFFDALNAVSWRSGRAFPENYSAMRQLMSDGELDIIFAFNPSEASNAIAAGELPDTVRSFTYTNGTLSNTHFLAIPYNAAAKAGALVTANFMLSPQAQAQKQDPTVWGDPTVLAMDKLTPEDRAAFEALDLGIATLAPADLGPGLDEPHPSWMARMEEEWLRRYGVAN